MAKRKRGKNGFEEVIGVKKNVFTQSWVILAVVIVVIVLALMIVPSFKKNVQMGPDETTSNILNTILEPMMGSDCNQDVYGYLTEGNPSEIVINGKVVASAEGRQSLCDLVGGCDVLIEAANQRWIANGCKTCGGSITEIGANICTSFIRGDANNDKKVDSSDSIYINDFLACRVAKPNCTDAADVNDDEVINSIDSQYITDSLFHGGPDPRSPYPTAGTDEACDEIDNDLDGLVDEGCPPVGKLNVTSIPSNAGIFINNAIYGVTPTTVTLNVGNYDLKLIKSGYNDYIQSIVIQVGQITNVRATLTLQTGSLNITSNPANAAITIDNLFYGGTPTTITGLSIGNHTIKLTKSGYNDYIITKYINAGNNILSVILTPATIQTGNLSVTSNPANATLYIDNVLKGITPITISGLTLGNHAVKLTKTGYNNYTTTKNITAGINLLSVTLTAVPTTGNLSVTSNPTNASLYIDNVLKGMTPITVAGLSVGSHAVKLTKTGYSDYTTTKNITVGSNSLSATLTVAIGSLSVMSNPSSASFYLDNVYKGLTPYTVSNLTVGSHAVKLTKTGYNNYTTSVYVNPTTNSINVTLTPAV